jgi:hypothetical protein
MIGALLHAAGERGADFYTACQFVTWALESHTTKRLADAYLPGLFDDWEEELTKQAQESAAALEVRREQRRRRK